jgi:hypothetical protein
MSGTAVVTGLSSSRFIWTNFATSGGNFLVICNGVDSVRNYNGTVWSIPSITVVASSTLSYVFQFKSRLFFLQKDTSKAWYLPADSIAGAATALNIGAELRLGGTVVAGGSFSHDAGNGPDDYCAFISSEGEVVIYAGTDPGSATTWALVGIFRIGRPIGNRCLVKIGGDLAVLTQDGMIALSSALQIDRSVEQKAAFTANIRTAFASQYGSTGTLHGWEVHTWAKGHMALVNVPLSESTLSQQYVMNTLTGAWARFTNINSLCWAISQDNFYFGTPDGYIMRFGEAGSDNGEDINAICIGAFSDMKNPGVIKHAKTALVFARAAGSFQLGVNILSDFRVSSTATSTAAFSLTSDGPLWDVALWDEATWAEDAETVVNQAWMGIAGSGHYLAPVVLTVANETDPSDVEFIAMNVLYEMGSPLG